MWTLKCAVMCALVAADPLVGVFNEIGPSEAYYSQMVLHANATADFSFLINSGCGRHKIPAPLLWEIKNMDYITNADGTLSFLTKPEDANRTEIVDINKVFATMGTFKLPIKVRVSADNTLLANVLRLSVNLKQQPMMDMKKLLSKLKGEPEIESPTAAAPSCCDHKSEKPVDLAAAPQASATAQLSWLLVAMPLAAGMTDWLSYL